MSTGFFILQQPWIIEPGTIKTTLPMTTIGSGSGSGSELEDMQG